jgi:glycosyltransferase involved in cell wall biosynthesis
MEQKPARICFLADTHDLFDDRIYWKEALSLMKHGFDVHYLLAGEDEKTGITGEGISYYIIRKDPLQGSRIINFLFKKFHPQGLYNQMFHKARKIRADVYHIHDLKVNRIGNRLKNLPHKPKVVYDVHEPYPENIMDYCLNKCLPRVFIKWYSGYVRRKEKARAKNYDLIITTEENIHQRFKEYYPDKPVEIIYNYTNLPRKSIVTGSPEIQYDAIYTGGITRLRGAWKILEALRLVIEQHPGFKMLFLGSWFPETLKKEMETFISQHKLQQNVELKDRVPYPEVTRYYLQSRIGLGIFLPVATHRIILQIKIFEYMNFGLPVVGSNFGHIHNILTEHQCGITVDPENPAEIAEALLRLLSDEGYRAVLSQNAIQAVDNHFRWEYMENKLAGLYNNLIRS